MSLLSRLFLLTLLLPSAALSGTLRGVGGIDEEPAGWTEFTNSVSDAGFEATTAWTVGSGCARSSEQAATGTYSLKCTGSFGTNFQLIAGGVGFHARQQRFKVYPGADATGSIRVEMYNNSRGGTSYGGVTVYAETGAYLARKEVNAPKEAWTTVVPDSPFYTLPGMADDNIQMRVRRVTATGTWYFDDIEVFAVVPLVRTFIKYPNFRGFLWSDWSQTVSGVVEANAPEGGALSDYKAVVKVYKVVEGGANTLEDTITMETFTDGEATFSFDAGAYSADDEFIFETELQLKANSAVVATFADWRVVLKDKTVRDGLEYYFDTDNKLVKEGARQFVYGVYDRIRSNRCLGCVYTDQASYENIAGFDGMTNIESYVATKANTTLYWSLFSGANPGFNVDTSDVTDPLTYDSAKDQLNPWVDALDDEGIGHLHIINYLHEGKTLPTWMTSPGKEVTYQEGWQVYATYPKSDGFLAWYAGDEPDYKGGTTQISEEQIWDQYDAFKDFDPYTPLTVTLYRGWPTTKWRELVDVVGCDPYYIGQTSASPEDHHYGDTTPPFHFRVNQNTQYTDDSAHNSRPNWAVLQLFKYGGEYPSLSDTRKMAWKAIVAGADGILWWAWADSVGMERIWYVDQEYDKWYDYEQVSNEIMGIEDALVGTDVTDEVTCSDSDIDYRALSNGTDIYVIASNTSESAQVGVQFSHADVGGSVEVYSESRSIVSSGTTFTDNFDSDYGVHVYKLSKNSRIFFNQTGTTNFNQAGAVNFNQ